jgi:hypothetical protein
VEFFFVRYLWFSMEYRNLKGSTPAMTSTAWTWVDDMVFFPVLSYVPQQFYQNPSTCILESTKSSSYTIKSICHDERPKIHYSHATQQVYPFCALFLDKFYVTIPKQLSIENYSKVSKRKPFPVQYYTNFWICEFSRKQCQLRLSPWNCQTMF